jgi:Cu+-exporting ATPase
MPPTTPTSISISTIFTSFANSLRTPLSATGGKVLLPTAGDEYDPLVTDIVDTMYEKCELRIEGMTCGACVEVSLLVYSACRVLIHYQSIEGMLRDQPGIHSIKVALLAERGVIEYDPNSWDVDKLINVSASPF